MKPIFVFQLPHFIFKNVQILLFFDSISSVPGQSLVDLYAFVHAQCVINNIYQLFEIHNVTYLLVQQIYSKEFEFVMWKVCIH